LEGAREVFSDVSVVKVFLIQPMDSSRLSRVCRGIAIFANRGIFSIHEMIFKWIQVYSSWLLNLPKADHH